MVERKPLEQVIAGHELRNASLRDSLIEKSVDLGKPRQIDCHFWAWTKSDARELSKSLEARGFKIMASAPAAGSNEDGLWNIEAAVKQSIDLTMRREFTDELATLADSCKAIYDGWGTQI